MAVMKGAEAGIWGRTTAVLDNIPDASRHPQRRLFADGPVVDVAAPDAHGFQVAGEHLVDQPGGQVVGDIVIMEMDVEAGDPIRDG